VIQAFTNISTEQKFTKRVYLAYEGSCVSSSRFMKAPLMLDSSLAIPTFVTSFCASRPISGRPENKEVDTVRTSSIESFPLRPFEALDELLAWFVRAFLAATALKSGVN
jgi:hypothetical protein